MSTRLRDFRDFLTVGWWYSKKEYSSYLRVLTCFTYNSSHKFILNGFNSVVLKFGHQYKLEHASSSSADWRKNPFTRNPPGEDPDLTSILKYHICQLNFQVILLMSKLFSDNRLMFHADERSARSAVRASRGHWLQVRRRRLGSGYGHYAWFPMLEQNNFRSWHVCMSFVWILLTCALEFGIWVQTRIFCQICAWKGIDSVQIVILLICTSLCRTLPIA